MANIEHSGPVAAGDFRHTQWSVVLAAGQTDSPETREALAELCQAYWHPVYAFIRRRGYEVEPSKDLTQEFFARLIEKQYVRTADRQRGRFRSFLLACVEHFLSHERKKDQAHKRGGQYTFVPLEDAMAEERYGAEPVDEMSPDKLFDQRWALALLERSLQQLKQEFVQAGKADQFEALEVFLSGAKEAPCSYAELGVRLDLSEGAARQAAFRMRARFGELLRTGMAQTVTSPQELEAEMNHLRNALSSPSVGL